MGLDIRLTRRDPDQEFHAQWSYGGFSSFRRRIAEQIGLVLDEMIGFGGETEWPDPKEEPLVYLLNHSDCDGHLGRKKCEALGPRLRKFIETWPDESMPNGIFRDPLGHDFEMGMRLAAMCDEVASGDADRVIFE